MLQWFNRLFGVEPKPAAEVVADALTSAGVHPFRSASPSWKMYQAPVTDEEHLEEMRQYFLKSGGYTSILTGSECDLEFLLSRFTIEELIEKYGPDATLADIQEAVAFQQSVEEDSKPAVQFHGGRTVIDSVQAMNRINRAAIVPKELLE